jgi:hypothetical protein
VAGGIDPAAVAFARFAIGAVAVAPALLLFPPGKPGWRIVRAAALRGALLAGAIL